MRVLVCGGRDFLDYKLLVHTLTDLINGKPVIVQGGAIGADFLAKVYAYQNKLVCEEYKADWNKHGKKAGPIRNQQMLDEGKPDLVVAFPTPNSIGTWDMIKRATDTGIEVKVIT